VTWNERIDLRHRQRKIFENSDDPRLRRAFITGYDQHYDDDQGAWQDCVEGYETSDVVGYNQMARRLRHALHVANNGGRRWHPRRNVPGEYIQFGRLQYWNGTSWVNVPFGTPVVTNNQIFWDHTLFSLKLFVNWHRIKIEAVLKSSGAARPLRWAVSLVGLTWDNWQLRGQDGSVVAHVDAPQGWDANGSQDDPNIAVTASYSGGFIRFDADLSAAVYPVTVDPTLTLQPAAAEGKDNRIDSGNPTWNYGTVGRFDMFTTVKGLIEYDLSSIPATATCDSATFYTYQANSGAALAWTVTVYSIASGNEAWIEGTQFAGLAAAGEPCWNALAADGAGGVTTAWAGSAGLATSGTDYEASSIGSFSGNRSDANGTEYSTALTAARVAGWFSGSNTNYGMLLVTSAGVGGFGTSDNATAGYRPKLVVDYTEAGQPMNARGVRVPGMRQWQPGRQPGF